MFRGLNRSTLFNAQLVHNYAPVEVSGRIERDLYMIKRYLSLRRQFKCLIVVRIARVKFTRKNCFSIVFDCDRTFLAAEASLELNSETKCTPAYALVKMCLYPLRETLFGLWCLFHTSNHRLAKPDPNSSTYHPPHQPETFCHTLSHCDPEQRRRTI